MTMAPVRVVTLWILLLKRYDLSKSEAARKLIELAGTRGLRQTVGKPLPATSPGVGEIRSPDRTRKRRTSVEGWPAFEAPTQRGD